MTVTEMTDYVRRVHNAESDTNWSDTELYQLIQAKCNDVVSVVGLIQAIDTSITTVASTQSYSYPSNVIRIRRVQYDGRPTKLISLREFETRQPTGVAATGTPFEHVLWADKIIFYPTPNAAETVTLYVEKQQSAITSGSSTVDIPEVFHSAVADAVISMMFDKDLNNAFSAKYEAKWLNFHIPNMKRYAQMRRHTGGPLRVADSDSSLETDSGVI